MVTKNKQTVILNLQPGYGRRTIGSVEEKSIKDVENLSPVVWTKPYFARAMVGLFGDTYHSMTCSILDLKTAGLELPTEVIIKESPSQKVIIAS